jgi:hypothetical protein
MRHRLGPPIKVALSRHRYTEFPHHIAVDERGTAEYRNAARTVPYAIVPVRTAMVFVILSCLTLTTVAYTIIEYPNHTVTIV